MTLRILDKIIEILVTRLPPYNRECKIKISKVKVQLHKKNLVNRAQLKDKEKILG
jgi:hypothetical protein